MYNVEKCSAVLENAAGFTRLDAYIWSRNKMAALGYVYTLEKQTSRSPQHCTSWNATSAEVLEVKIPLHILVYDRNPQALEAHKQFGRKNKKKKKDKNMKK